MAIREIIKIPDAKLREISKPIEQVDAAVLKLLDDMAETMYDAPGIGLAAIQIAEPIRALLVDVTERAETEDGEEKTEPDPALEKELRNPIFMINPEIVAFSEAPSTYEEGCLSIPDYFAEVDRPAGCTVTYIDRDGKEQVLEAEGLLSTCIQHEIDHLNGKLFIDLLSKLKRDMVIKKFTKAAKQAGKLPEKRMIG
ncbi:MAG: peptide deformylase [Pseudomonadota bacterium]